MKFYIVKIRIISKFLNITFSATLRVGLFKWGLLYYYRCYEFKQNMFIISIACVRRPHPVAVSYPVLLGWTPSSIWSVRGTRHACATHVAGTRPANWCPPVLSSPASTAMPTAARSKADGWDACTIGERTTFWSRSPHKQSPLTMLMLCVYI